MSHTTIHINLDTLIFAHEAQPDTAHQRKAWIWLAEQDTFRFVGAALVVDSATWINRAYYATPTQCACPGKAMCWHRAAAQAVAAAMAEDARYDALAARDECAAPVSSIKTKPARSQAEKMRIEAEMQELFV